MTTVAWDGETLAADRLVTSGDNIKAAATRKVARRESDGALIGCAGEVCTIHAFMEWFFAGEEGVRPSLKASNLEHGCAAAIIVRPGLLLEFHDKCGWHPIESRPIAIGSGELGALVAMRCGKTAIQAVEIVSEFDVWSGGGVDWVTMRAIDAFSVAPATDDGSEMRRVVSYDDIHGRERALRDGVE